MKPGLSIVAGFLGLGGIFAGLRSAAPVEVPVLASYATPLTGRMGNQIRNARLSAARLNGIEIPAKGEFSFNKTVGSWSRDQGFQRAPVSFNGQLVEAVGGGVCQTSTTLYNAALIGGLEILERHRHQFAPSYVPPGRDAAVAYDTVDLRLRNPYAVPIRIVAKVEDDRLRVDLTGLPRPSYAPHVREVVREVRPPNTFRFVSARRDVRNAGKPGFEVEVYRIWPDRRELVSQDSYPAMNRVIEVPAPQASR